MRKILFLLLILIFFIQYSFIDVMSSSSAWGVDLISAFLISLWLKEGTQNKLMWAFVAGLLVDYFSSMNLGTYIIIFIFLSIMVELYKTKFVQSQKKIVMVFIAMFFGQIFVDLVLFIFMKSEIFFGRNIDNVMFEGINMFQYFVVKLVMSIVGVGVYKIIDYIYEIAGKNTLELKIGVK